MSVTRRRLLKTLATISMSGAGAGCVTAGDAVSNRSPSDTAHQTDDQRSTNTDSQKPPERDLFDRASCPSFSETDRTVCWHTHDDGTEVAIKPSQQLFQPVSGNNTVETITFTLTNTRDAPILFNPHSWAIMGKTADGWKDVASGKPVKPLYELDPGTSYKWVVSRQQHPHPRTTRAVYPTVELTNGRHAFVLTGSLADDTPNKTETADEQAGTTVEWVTLFEVERLTD